MKGVFQQIEQIKLSQDTNLWSYICLKGTSILSFKWQGKERDYTEKKRKLLEEICITFRNTDLRHIKEALKQVREALVANGYRVKVCKIKAISKVMIGTGGSFGKVPFEVGLSFDPILNVPFISGSSLKGAFRHALLELIKKGPVKKNTHKEAINAESIANIIFGSEKWSGLVGVTDAYPVKPGINGLIFEPDVITPHYPGAMTELDVNPNPISFLTIARDLVFEFFIYFNKRVYKLEHKYLRKMNRQPRRKCTELKLVKELYESKGGEEVLEYAVYKGDLEKALKADQERNPVNLIPWIDRTILYAFARGIGAKTSIGYSRFAVVEYRIV